MKFSAALLLPLLSLGESGESKVTQFEPRRAHSDKGSLPGLRPSSRSRLRLGGLPTALRTASPLPDRSSSTAQDTSSC